MNQTAAISSVSYLQEQGFNFKPANDPMLWTHLEQMIGDSFAIGGKFAPVTSSRLTEMISHAESAALVDMAEQHRKSGTLGVVETVITMPFIVGTEAVVPMDSVAEDQRYSAIIKAGDAREQCVTIVPVADDAVPSTKQMTVKSGLYADGQTLGLWGVQSGGHSARRFGGQGAFLVTKRDVREIVASMTSQLDEITTVTRAEGEEMLKRLRNILD